MGVAVEQASVGGQRQSFVVAGPSQLYRRRRGGGFPAAVEVAAQVAATYSPQRISAPAHRVGDGPGDLRVVQADPLGHLPADMLGRKRGDDGGDIAGGAHPAFGPAQCSRSAQRAIRSLTTTSASG